MTLSLDDLLNSLTEDTGVEKVASATEVAASTANASDAAAELEKTLTKQANETEVKTPMATPQEKGHAIADSILSLVKQAMDGLAPTAPENRLISETAAQVAHSTAGLAETDRSGTMTEVLQSLVANSAANGAVRDEALAENAAGSTDETAGEAENMASSDGEDLDAEDADEVEKVAAVVTLVDNGFDFDTAVEMVKQAAAEIEEEEFEQVKIAAVNALMDEGIDLESAVALVKEASKIDGAKKAIGAAAKKAKGAASEAGEKAKGLFDVKGRFADATVDAGFKSEVSKAKRDIAKAHLIPGQKGNAVKGLKEDAAHVGRMAAYYGKAGAKAAGPAAAVAGGVGVGAYAATREKKAAAIEALTGAGYTVAEALELLGE